MTSIMTSEAAADIKVTCTQTRFDIKSPNYRELDIDGLDITVVSSIPTAPTPSTPAAADTAETPSVPEEEEEEKEEQEKTATKGKTSKLKAAKGKKGKDKDVGEGRGTEILTGASLKLKAGQRYALVGKNGSGKSTLLRAISEKRIPGIPEETRIATLQQTDSVIDTTDKSPDAEQSAEQHGGPNVLEDVVNRATARLELEKEISVLEEGVDSSDLYKAFEAARKIKHERMQRKHFVLDKNAKLRSGARGLQARKTLAAFEKELMKSEALNEQKQADISAEALQAGAQEAADMLAELHLQVEPSRLADIESQAKKILKGLGFSDPYTARPAASLSGGWKMRASLAAMLLQETDILVLDEPTNFLDLMGIVWLQKHLETLEDDESPPTLILVSHDRDFISHVCTDLVILKDKKLTYYHGDLASYEASLGERIIHLKKLKEAEDKQRQHYEQTIIKTRVSGRAADDQNKLRQAKSRQKRLDDRMGMMTNEKGGRFKLSRDRAGFHDSAREEIIIPQEDKKRSMVIPEPLELRFPGPLLSLDDVTFRYPAPKPKTSGPSATPTLTLGVSSRVISVQGTARNTSTPAAPTLSNVSLSVNMGDRIGILGLNGAGKSTMIRLLVADSDFPTSPASGNVTRHPRMKLGYYSQHAVANLLALGERRPHLTPLQLLTEEIEGALPEPELRALCGSLGLPGRLASDIPIRKLSGGQLVRCELARILWKRPHCLVLDEVTTHLDYETVAALKEALRPWPGAVVLVSHDRWFMKGVVEGIVDDEGVEGSDHEDDEDDEVTGGRRRMVYKLAGGKLTQLDGGVGEFEKSMEKKVRRLMAA